MEIIVCIDDKGGMLFNKRRQSKDGALMDDIKASARMPIYVDAFSEKLFLEYGVEYKIAEPHGDCSFFVENRKVSELIKTCTRAVIYKWNRAYPSDFKFDIDLAKEGFSLRESIDFKGSSHEKITKEVYER